MEKPVRKAPQDTPYPRDPLCTLGKHQASKSSIVSDHPEAKKQQEQSEAKEATEAKKQNETKEKKQRKEYTQLKEKNKKQKCQV